MNDKYGTSITTRSSPAGSRPDSVSPHTTDSHSTKKSNLGFSRSSRLKVKAEFDRVFSRPNERCSNKTLQAIFKPTLDATAGSPRLGLVIAKRFLPLAVQRNRVKRLIREGFRQVQGDLPPVDVIVRLTQKPQSEVNAGDVASLFGKIKRSESRKAGALVPD